MNTASSGSASRAPERSRRKKWPWIVLAAALIIIVCAYFATGDIRNIRTDVFIEAGGQVEPALFFAEPDENAEILTDLGAIGTSTIGEHKISIRTRFAVVQSRLTVRDTVAPAAEAQTVEVYAGNLPEPEDLLVSVQDATAVTAVYSEEPDVNTPGEQAGIVLLTDAAGNTTQVSVCVTVISDTQAPVISGVHDIVMYTARPADPTAGVTVSDDHDEAPSLQTDLGGFDPSVPGVYTLTFTASDFSGNTASETASVVVIADMQTPVISGVHDIIMYTARPADPTAGVAVSDDHDEAPSFQTDLGGFDPSVPGEYTLTFTAADFSGNIASETASVAVIADTQAPVISGAHDIVMYTARPADPTSGVTVSDDHDEAPSLQTDLGGFDPAVPGEYTLTFTAADFSGNIASETAVVTVRQDSIAPMISGVRNATLFTGEEFDAAAGVSVTDETDESPSFLIDDSLLDLSTAGVYPVHYAARDFSGNSVSATAQITVLDDLEPPVISGVQDHIVYIGDTLDYLSGVSASDNRDPAPTLSIDDPGVDFTTEGVYTVRFAAADDRGNLSEAVMRIKVMADTEKPVITGVQDYEVYLGDTVDYISGVSVTDNRDSDIRLVIDDSSVNLNQIDSYTVTYTATDSSGNTARERARIRVKRDKTAPQIEGAQDISVEMFGTISYRKGITVTDDHDPAPKLSIDNSRVNLGKAGRYKVFYTATDDQGNSRTVSIRVTVTRKQLGDDDIGLIWPLADEVLASIITDDMTDMEKAFKIYGWCRRNIHYSGSSDKSHWVMGAYDAFTLRSGDCWNYYAAAKALLTRAGIDNIDIIKDENEYTRHFWNLINLGYGWYHFDSCPFDAGDDDFFMLTDEELFYWDRTHRGAHPFDSELYPERATQSVQKKLNYSKFTVKE